MDKREIEKRLIYFVREELKIDDRGMTEKSNLFEDGYIDSILLEKFFSIVEDKFGILFEEDNFFDERFSTISGVAGIIIELKSKL